MSIKPEAVIYTDGACSGNPGPGGWAAVVMVGDSVQELSGGEPYTTNNRQELLGVINGLKALRGHHIVKVVSDSQYIINAFNKGWLASWKKNGWERKDGELKNADLWKELDRLASVHVCSFEWTRGHTGNRYNERCDRLACSQRDKFASETAGAEPEQPDIRSLDPESYIEIIQEILLIRHMEKCGTDAPCGGFDYCEGCSGGENSCAESYIRRYLKTRKGK